MISSLSSTTNLQTVVWFQVLLSRTINYISEVKLATIVEDNLKAPFSIATTQSCRGGCYFFPGIAPLYP